MQVGIAHGRHPCQVVENSENPCWKATGFSVPNVKEQRKKHPTEATTLRPLDSGVVETRELDDAALLTSLAEKGLAVKPATSGDYHAVECDVAIVGSGCGGGVAAAVLASAGHKVLVVEKGDYFTPDDYSSVEGPSMERLYEQGGIFCTSNVTTVLYAGTTVGGGSAGEWDATRRPPPGDPQGNNSGKNGRSKKCVGLVATCMSNGITKKLRIEAKVSISACGALMTPPLLRNSGLRNRHVGRNLHLHPVSMAWGYFPDTNQEPQLTGKCYEGGIITSMHRVTERTIIETPALGPGAFASLVPWESGRDMKERMRRPSRGDIEELRDGLRRALRIMVASGAAEVGTHRSDGLRLRWQGVQDQGVEALARAGRPRAFGCNRIEVNFDNFEVTKITKNEGRSFGLSVTVFDDISHCMVGLVLLRQGLTKRGGRRRRRKKKKSDWREEKSQAHEKYPVKKSSACTGTVQLRISSTDIPAQRTEK
uniref:Glucose-methanol-choline oxidoreductase N-terminal domain-containing protein n=1 Tax=Aegilops tauschii TaxID=37682 RepID=M8AJH5_AEGTA